MAQLYILQKPDWRKRLLALLIFLMIFFTSVYIAGFHINKKEQWTIKDKQVLNKTYNQNDFRGNLDSLKALFGHHKQLPEGYELQALLALSHYPELKDVNIHFSQTEAIIPLASRPEPVSMFTRKEKWQYNIVISTKSLENLEPILLKNLPFNAQIGIIGHELAHTVFYSDKGIGEMLLIGLNYPFPSFRARFEKNTDRRTIAHGLGWQLLEYATHVREKMDYENTSFGEAYYLIPDQIKKQIAETY